jgi:hypothetical protein
LVIDQAAISIRLLVEIPDGWQAQVRQATSEFVEIFLTQDLSLALIGTPGHAGAFYSFRRLFATG